MFMSHLRCYCVTDTWTQCWCKSIVTVSVSIKIVQKLNIGVIECIRFRSQLNYFWWKLICVWTWSYKQFLIQFTRHITSISFCTIYPEWRCSLFPVVWLLLFLSRLALITVIRDGYLFSPTRPTHPPHIRPFVCPHQLLMVIQDIAFPQQI